MNPRTRRLRRTRRHAHKYLVMETARLDGSWRARRISPPPLKLPTLDGEVPATLYLRNGQVFPSKRSADKGAKVATEK